MNTFQISSRQNFPDLESKAYLNHAAISPPSSPVIATVQQVMKSYAKQGVQAIHQWIDQRERLRQKIANLIQAHPEEVGLSANTTGGIVHIAHAIPWKEGDRVLLFNGEFPTNITPWQQAVSRCNGEVVFMDLSLFESHPEEAIQQVSKILSDGVRLVACSAVQFQTGFAMPLAALGKLCHDNNTLFSVDAIQACGIRPIDVQKMNIDFLSCGSHKWLMGIEGCGFIYIRADLFDYLNPQTAGWISHESGLSFLFDGPNKLHYDRPIKRNASFIEHGAMNAVGFAALETSLDMVLSIGINRIYQHVQEYHNKIETIFVSEGFQSHRPSNPNNRSGILSFTHPRFQADTNLLSLFSKYDISCSTPDGYLRFSPHWPNNLNEVDYIADVIRDIVDAATPNQA